MKITSLVISAVIMIITSIIFAGILLDSKNIKISKKNIITIFVAIIIYSLIIINLSGTYKTLLLCILYVLLFSYLFRKPKYEMILLVFLYTIITIVPDTLFLLLLMYGLKLDPEVCYAQYTNSLTPTLFVCIVLILITFIFQKPLKKLLNLKIDNSKIILIYTFLTLGSIVIIFYKATSMSLINDNLIQGFIIMIIFVVILYSLIRQKMENNKIVEKYDKLLEFIKQYEVEVEEQRIIRHESKNQLITLKSKILSKENTDRIVEYIDELLKDHYTYKNEKYGKFQYLPANGLKGLFYYKSMEAEEKGLKLSINVSAKIENSFLNDLNADEFKQLGRLVGVYLDNAIEASLASEERKLGIEIYKIGEDIIIIISNTYSGNIDSESIGNVKYTTKGKNHGYGLMLASKILNENSMFESKRSITNNFYEQKLTIKNTKTVTELDK